MEYLPEGYTYDIESDGDSDYQKVRMIQWPAEKLALMQVIRS